MDSEDGEPINFNGVGWTKTILLHITRIADLGIREIDMKKITLPISMNLPLSETHLAKKEPQNEELRILES